MLVHLIEKGCHMVSVLTDPRLQAVVLINQTDDLALSVLGQALLLLEHVAELLVLCAELADTLMGEIEPPV